ncbi:hypothetical protein PMAYCL1PPCAC_13510, partial [Pristionchus mayeri]
ITFNCALRLQHCSNSLVCTLKVTSDGILVTSTIIRTTNDCDIKHEIDFSDCTICVSVPGFAEFQMGLNENVTSKGLEKEWHLTGSIQVMGQWTGAGMEGGKTLIHFTLTRDPAGYLNFVMATTVHITTLVVLVSQMFAKSPMTVAIVALVFIQVVFLLICFSKDGPNFVTTKTRSLTDSTGCVMIVNAICQEFIAFAGRWLLGDRRAKTKEMANSPLIIIDRRRKK